MRVGLKPIVDSQSQVERNYSDSIPPNMDINHAAKETLTESVRYALTQVRGEMKKTVRARKFHLKQY